jgi:hypothetical protein
MAASQIQLKQKRFRSISFLPQWAIALQTPVNTFQAQFDMILWKHDQVTKWNMCLE